MKQTATYLAMQEFILNGQRNMQLHYKSYLTLRSFLKEDGILLKMLVMKEVVGVKQAVVYGQTLEKVFKMNFL